MYYNGVELPPIPAWPYEHYNPPERRYPYAIITPNRITGEGRTRCRASFYKNKVKDLKKKEHRKMAKKSRRRNRRAKDGN